VYQGIYLYTDAFAFGILMWECFARVRAFAHAHHDVEIQAMVLRGERPDLSLLPEVVEGIPVRTVIAACWEHGW
jgi:hypothetical protein